MSRAEGEHGPVWSGNAHVSRRKLGDLPVEQAVVAKGRQLDVAATVAEARELLAPEPVQLVPVLDGRSYVGALLRDSIPADADPDGPAVRFASPGAAVARAGTPLDEALAALDDHGSRRLVVVERDGSTFVGVVCLRGDRDRLCIDAELLARSRGQGGSLRSARAPE